jgi:hypothetical protein
MTLRLILCGSLLVLAACGQEPASESPAAEQANLATEPMALTRTASADGASVFFITPTDGATLTNPVSVEFGIAGMDVVKAGNNQPHSGHHHLLIDTGLPELGLPIPADDHHKHFGDGSTTTQITLPPGAHTLQMLLGDHLHIPHDPALTSAQITITVE